MRGTVRVGGFRASDTSHFVPFDYGADPVPAGEEHLVGQGMLVTPLDAAGDPYFLVSAEGEGFAVEGEGWIVPVAEAEALAGRLTAGLAGPVSYRERA